MAERLAVNPSLPAIRAVLAAYRSTKAHITEAQIIAAWAEYEQTREFLRANKEKAV